MGFLPDRKPGLHRIENWYASTPTNQINFELWYWERGSLRWARNKVSQIGLKVKRCQGLLKAFMLIPARSSSVDYLIFDLLLRPWKLELWSQRIPLQYLRMKTPLTSAQADKYATMFLSTGQPVFRTTCFLGKKPVFILRLVFVNARWTNNGKWLCYVCAILFLTSFFEKWIQFVLVFALT